MHTVFKFYVDKDTEEVDPTRETDIMAEIKEHRD